MKIADYGKAITSYIESPTTAQKLKSKKLAGLMEEYLGDQLDYQKAVDEGFQGTEEEYRRYKSTSEEDRTFLAEGTPFDFSGLSVPQLKLLYKRYTGTDGPSDPKQLISELKRLIKGLDEDGIPFATGGRVHLAEGSEDIVEPSKSMQVDTTTKGLDLFTIDDFKKKAEIYVGAYHNNALPTADIKAALNKFTQKGIDDGTFSADDAIKIVQDLKFQFQDRAQKQRLRDNIIAGTGTVEREERAIGGGVIEGEDLGTREGFFEPKLVSKGPNKGKIAVDFFIDGKKTAHFPTFEAANKAIAQRAEDFKKFKKARKILNDPKLKKEFIEFANRPETMVNDIYKKYNILSAELYGSGLKDLIKKDFTKSKGRLREKTVNNMLLLHNNKLSSKYIKKGLIVPDDILAALKITPTEAATATTRLAQLYGGKNFLIDKLKSIKVNKKASNKLFDTMNKFAFGNPYRHRLYDISLELIDEQLGKEKGTFESLKKKASYILKKNKIKGFDINEITGVTGTARSGAGEFSQFIDVLDSNLNQKQGASFQSAFSQARQKIANNPALFDTEAKKINRLASKFESEYGFRLPRIRKLEDVEKFYSPKRLKDLTDQGIDIKKASKKLGYTIQMPKGAVTIQEFVEKPGLKEKFLKGIGTGAKAFGKVIKPVGYAIGTAAAYQAKSMADEMGIELKPQDYFMAVDSGDPEVAINNAKRRMDPEFAAAERAKDLAKMTDDFEEVGQTTFGKYNDQIKNIKLP